MGCKHEWLGKPEYGERVCAKCQKITKMPKCPSCGSYNIVKSGVYSTSRRKCLDCGEEWVRQF